jgi:hypothetical protein
MERAYAAAGEATWHHLLEALHWKTEDADAPIDRLDNAQAADGHALRSALRDVWADFCLSKHPATQRLTRPATSSRR